MIETWHPWRKQEEKYDCITECRTGIKAIPVAAWRNLQTKNKRKKMIKVLCFQFSLKVPVPNSSLKLVHTPPSHSYSLPPHFLCQLSRVGYKCAPPYSLILSISISSFALSSKHSGNLWVPNKTSLMLSNNVKSPINNIHFYRTLPLET